MVLPKNCPCILICSLLASYHSYKSHVIAIRISSNQNKQQSVPNYALKFNPNKQKKLILALSTVHEQAEFMSRMIHASFEFHNNS